MPDPLATPARPQRPQRPASVLPPVLEPVVQQHAEEAALLRHVRTRQVRAPHVQLLQLGRLDARIEAHLDGLAVAGPAGKRLALQALEGGACGEVFTLGVLALRSADEELLAQLLELAPVLPEAQRGLASSFGWVSAEDLKGVVQRLLAGAAAPARALALAACRMHRVDPGPVLATALADADAGVRTAALAAASALGRVDLLPAVRAAIGDGMPAVVLQAALSACRLGERRSSFSVLRSAALREGEAGRMALQMLLAASTPAEAQEFARHLAAVAQAQPSRLSQRRLIRALGLLGDARHVPWLVERMRDTALARLAGESFCWITGADLAQAGPESMAAPPGLASPSEDPADDAVDLDEDEDLAWPDVEHVERWWARQATPAQAPAFLGRAPSTAAYAQALREASMRQRRHAALCLALQQPTQPWFPVSAPAWRQRRWLGLV